MSPLLIGRHGGLIPALGSKTSWANYSLFFNIVDHFEEIV